MSASTVLFEEVQPFRQKGLEAVLLVLNGGLLVLYLFETLLATTPDRPVGLLVALLLVGGITLLLKRLKLITQITTAGIQVRFAPVQGRFQLYRWASIEQVYLRTYNPLAEYGGWGIRFGPAGGAYNVAGTVGLQLHLAGNHRFLIGTQQPELLLAALQAAGAS